MAKQLIHGRCLEGLEKANLDKAAVALAKQMVQFGDAVATASTTLGFVEADETIEAEFIAELTVTVKRPPTS